MRALTALVALVALALPWAVSAQPVAPDAVQAAVVGVLTPDADGPRLLVRQVGAGGPVSTPSALTLRAGDPPVALEPRGDATALAATGEASTVLVLVENRPLDGAALDAATHGARVRGIVDAVRATFNPGETFGMAALAGAAFDAFARLAPTASLDEVQAFATEQLDGTGARGALLEQLRLAIAALHDPNHTHTEAIVVAAAGADADALPALVSDLRSRGVPLSALLVTAADASVDAAAAVFDTDPLCVAARQTGGVCRVASGDPAQLAESARLVLSEAQSLFVVPTRCGEGLAGLERVNIVVTAGGRESEPMMVEAPRLACETWRRFAPGWTAESEVAAAEGSAAAAAVAVNGSPQPELPAVESGGVPRVALFAGAVVVVLLVAVVAVLATRRRASSLDIDDVAVPGAAGADMRITALDTLAPNANAAALRAQGPVPDRPAWLREPAVAATRTALRSHLSRTDGRHLVHASGDSVWEVPLSGVVLAGSTPEAHIPCPSLGAGQVALRFVLDGPTVRVQYVDHSVPVELNGAACPAETVLRWGDELVVGGATVIEVRSVASDGSVPALAPFARKLNRRLIPRDDRAFDAISVDTISTLVGRDPLPYRGLRAVPAKLVISQVSNDHAELWTSGGVLYVRDLGSSNGTLLDGRRLDPLVTTPIAPQQRLSLSALLPFSVE